MADPEHVAKLKGGVEAWNRWRSDDGRAIILRSAELSSASLRCQHLPGANLELADMTKADLFGAILCHAVLSRASASRVNLRNSNLAGATFWASDMRWADFRDAEITGADFDDANLWGADFANAKISASSFRNANLGHSNISGADISDSTFEGASLSQARIDNCKLSNTSLKCADLSGAFLSLGLPTDVLVAGAELSRATIVRTDLSGWIEIENAHLQGRANVDLLSVELTARRLNDFPSRRQGVESFLRASGAAEPFMQLFPTLIANPIEFYSGFLSHSHSDKPFARRLYDTLQGRGVRCWFDEKDMKLGERIELAVDEGIRLTDKLIVICSKASMASDWVRHEVRKAEKREEERPELYPILVPIELDGCIRDPDTMLGEKISARLAADFTGWESDNAKFEEQFERVVKALQTCEGRENPPEPQL